MRDFIACLTTPKLAVVDYVAIFACIFLAIEVAARI